MDILDDMGVSKLSAKVFSKVNYSFILDHILDEQSLQSFSVANHSDLIVYQKYA